MSIIDASLLTSATIVGDTHHVQARTWMESAQREGEALHAPAILLSEYGGAIRRVTGNRSFAAAAVNGLLTQPGLKIHDATADLCARAAEIAVQFGLRGCDAIYVALAERLGEPLVTLDNEQLTRAAPLIQVVRPG